MADAAHKPMIDRLAALVAGPFLLGRQALDLEWIHTAGGPPEPPTEAPARIAINLPEHAIKRRG